MIISNSEEIKFNKFWLPSVVLGVTKQYVSVMCPLATYGNKVKFLSDNLQYVSIYWQILLVQVGSV